VLEQEREKYRPIMAEAGAILAGTGDALSEAGLEAVARWKANGS
jgi:hypothetical protein